MDSLTFVFIEENWLLLKRTVVIEYRLCFGFQFGMDSVRYLLQSCSLVPVLQSCCFQLAIFNLVSVQRTDHETFYIVTMEQDRVPRWIPVLRRNFFCFYITSLHTLMSWAASFLCAEKTVNRALFLVKKRKLWLLLLVTPLARLLRKQGHLDKG